jgi:hypothetical protein
MAIFDKKEQPGDYYPEPAVVQKPKRSLFKWFALGVGTFFGVAHIGVLGHLLNRSQLPIINLPVGDYTAYQVDAHKDGYRIQYRSNDPRVMDKNKVLVKKNGFFGIGGDTKLVQQEEYTMDGAQHLQGGEVGKLTAKKIECIKAEGGGENAGRLVGTSIGASAAPMFSGIPYIGWLAAGWVAMFGGNTGAEIGGEVATMMKDCD